MRGATVGVSGCVQNFDGFRLTCSYGKIKKPEQKSELQLWDYAVQQIIHVKNLKLQSEIILLKFYFIYEFQKGSG